MNKILKCHFNEVSKGIKQEIYIQGKYLYIHYFDYHHSISLKDIDQVQLLVVSKLTGAFAMEKKDELSLKALSAFNRNQLSYYFDLIIMSRGEVIKIESDDMVASLSFLKKLKEEVTNFHDPIKLLEQFGDYQNDATNRDKLLRHLNIHYKTWSKQYNLENPRLEK